MELSQKMEVEAKMNLETEIDAGNADDVKLCIRMQTPKFVTKVKVWNRKATSMCQGKFSPLNVDPSDASQYSI